jgi:hypothetical protein
MDCSALTTARGAIRRAFLDLPFKLPDPSVAAMTGTDVVFETIWQGGQVHGYPLDPPHIVPSPSPGAGRALPVAKEEGLEVLAGHGLCLYRILPGTGQVPHRLVLLGGDDDPGQVTGPLGPRKGHGIPLVVLDPVAGLPGCERRCDDLAGGNPSS